MSATAEKQHLNALAQANAVRLGRAQLKREVRAGSVAVADLIRRPPDVLRSDRNPVSVTQILSWQPRWGVKRARIFLNPLGVGPYTTPFDLTRTRAEQIVRALP